MMNKEENQQKFDQLKELIQQRQQFEQANPGPPYSSYPTDINFPDADGLTLLRYAIRLGALETVKELIAKGAKLEQAIIFALNNDQLEMAKFFLELNNDCSWLKLSDVKEGESREWFKQLIKEALQEKTVNPNSFFDEASKKGPKIYESFFDFEGKSLDKYYRAAELGDTETLAQLKKQNEHSYRFNLSSMMNAAIENNQLDLIKLLYQDGLNLNPNSSFGKSYLYLAVLAGGIDSVDFLLKQGANIDYLNEFKHTALMAAVIRGSYALVDHLLNHHADSLIKDVYGRTALHYAAMNKQKDMIIRLLQDNNAEALRIKDIYGMTPLDYARENAFDPAIQLLEKEFNHPPARTNQPLIEINQGAVMQKMNYFLISEYRDRKFFNETGLCNGFAFLRDRYVYKGLGDYFYNTLELMAAWDGSKESLKKDFDSSMPQSKFYKNLEELFEQWINDLLWFQHSTLDEIFNYSFFGRHQSNREFHFNVVGDSDDKPRLISCSKGQTNTACFLENIKIFSKYLPKGCRLELAGSMHATSGFITEENTFNYYDPNFTRRARNFISEEDFTQAVIDTKLIMLGQYNNWAGDESFNSEMRFFYYYSKELQKQIEEHEVFSSKEYPNSKEEVAAFQANSPNKYTPLHLAVLTGSLKSVEKLIANETVLDELIMKTSQGKTALDMAIEAGNLAILTTLLSAYSTNQASSNEIVEAYLENKMEVIDLLLQYHQKVNLVPLFLLAVRKCDFALLSRLLDKQMVDINSGDQQETAMSIIIGETQYRLRAHQRLDARASEEEGSERISKEKTINELNALIRLLLNHGASLTKIIAENTFNSPLKLLARSDEEVLAIFLPFIDINQLDDSGNAFLHHLFEHGYSDLIKKFIENHKDMMDFNKPNAKGLTVFEILINKSDLLFGRDEEIIETAKILLPYMKVEANNSTIQKGIHRLLTIMMNSQDEDFFRFLVSLCSPEFLNAYDNKGATLLHNAIINHNSAFVKILVEAGADINIPTQKKQQSCLHLMVLTEDMSSLELLLEKGAKTDGVNADNKTVSDLVRESENAAIKEAFTQHFSSNLFKSS